MADLTRALGTAPPPEFGALSDTDRSSLADLVERAAQQRDALLDRAIDDSLRHIPALLRGTVRRALGV